MPDEVEAYKTSIDSLTGIGDYDWMATPTTVLRLHWLPLASIESGDFTGLGSLTNLVMNEDHITSIESGDFSGLDSLTDLNLAGNRIRTIEVGGFSGLDSLKCLRLDGNEIKSIESGDFSGLNSLTSLELGDNDITNIESGVFAELRSLTTLYLWQNEIVNIESGAFKELKNLVRLFLTNNRDLTVLNFDEADFSSLSEFDARYDTRITRVTLRHAVLNQASLNALIDDGKMYHVGIGGLRGIRELDLSGVDFSAITDLSSLYAMDGLTDLWIVDTENLDAVGLDTLLDNLRKMEAPETEGVLYMSQVDYDALNTAGGGLLAAWDAEVGHHVQIVPEPSALVLLAVGVVGLLASRGRRRRGWR
jgi:Leucine-rich repeat (LRR) protein